MRRLTTFATACAIGLAAMFPTAASAVGLIRDSEIERTLGMLSIPIFRAASLRPDAVDIYIVNDLKLNAFVGGGNNMFLNTGLLLKLKTPEEVQAVIAHEAGHIAGGHIARRGELIRNSRGPALLGILAGIAAGVAGSPQAGYAIFAGSQSAVARNYLSYSRGEEASADQAAMSYLSRAKIDPAGMQRVLDMFRGQEVFTVGNVDPYVLTHPLNTERVQLIEQRVLESEGKTYPRDPQLDYWHDRMRAKLKGFLLDPARVLNEVADQPETETVLYAKAVALYRLPSLNEALAAMDRLIALKPSDPFYLELKGQILFETGQAEEALPYYRQATRLAPGEPLLEAGLGRVLLALNTPEADREALEILQSARDRDPADALALRDLAVAYARAKQPGMATLATAERFALTGRMEDAILQAKRAASVLPEGSPGWLRAQDIISLKAE